MNQTFGKGAQVFRLGEPTKGVGSYRQQDDGHGSRNSLRNV